MNFISYEQLVKDVKYLARYVDHVDAIFGVPRSGLMVASMLALEAHKRLGAIDRYGKVHVIFHGGDRDKNVPVKKVLILDDSMDTGVTMENVSRYSDLSRYNEVYYGCIYKSPETPHFAGKPSYVREVPTDRFFEWNMWTSGVLDHAMIDIDGVLCPDGEESEEAFRKRTVLYRPLREVHAIVTGRLEEHRRATEEWLESNNIKHKALFMRESKDESAEEFKSRVFKMSPSSTLFIESFDSQAEYIAKKTGKPVLSIESMKLCK